MIHQETAEAYRACKAVSAGLLWEIVSECPAYAFAHSVFNPNPVPPKQSLEFDIGEATHLLTLEGTEFAARTTLIPYQTYQTQDARSLRDQAYVEGRVPLRPKDYLLVCQLTDALRESEAAKLLFGEGRSEVSYTWTYELTRDWTIACKARADRITPHAIIDLKTAMSASPTAFQRAMVRNGHHMRAAWYLDGWRESRLAPKSDKMPDYIYVIIAKAPPNLITVFTTGEAQGNNWFQIDSDAIHIGRDQYREALATVSLCLETGVWPGYWRAPNQLIGLPRWYEYARYQEENE